MCLCIGLGNVFDMPERFLIFAIGTYIAKDKGFIVDESLTCCNQQSERLHSCTIGNNFLSHPACSFSNRASARSALAFLRSAISVFLASIASAACPLFTMLVPSP